MLLDNYGIIMVEFFKSIDYYQSYIILIIKRCLIKVLK
jgi:hypothetical protein